MQLRQTALKLRAFAIYSAAGSVILMSVLWVVCDQIDVPEPIIVYTKGFNCAASVQARLVPGSLRQQFVSRLEPMVQGLISDTAIWRTSFILPCFRHTEFFDSNQRFSVSDNNLLRQQLRKLVRQRRQQLSPEQQQQAANSLVQQVLASAELKQSQHIALYLANDGELDTYPLIQALWQSGKTVYLPVLHPVVPGYLLFIHYDSNSVLYPNRFGIPEPLVQCHQLLPLNQLDIIFTPLVAFDKWGNRLGMGGGFYDRTLSQLPHNSHCQVIGLAHSCQQVDAVPVESWDVPLRRIITPDQLFKF